MIGHDVDEKPGIPFFWMIVTCRPSSTNKRMWRTMEAFPHYVYMYRVYQSEVPGALGSGRCGGNVMISFSSRNRWTRLDVTNLPCAPRQINPCVVGQRKVVHTVCVSLSLYVWGHGGLSLSQEPLRGHGPKPRQGQDTVRGGLFVQETFIEEGPGVLGREKETTERERETLVPSGGMARALSEIKETHKSDTHNNNNNNRN